MGTLNSVNERLDYLIKIKEMSDAKFMRETGTNNIGKMRSGKLAITEGTISKICQSLGVSYDWLKYGEGNMYENNPLHLYCGHENGEAIREQIKNGSPALDMVAQMMYNNVDHIQNISTGTERAKEDRIKLLEEKIGQLILVINAKDEIIKAKESEIRLLRKILADNGIEV